MVRSRDDGIDKSGRGSWKVIETYFENDRDGMGTEKNRRKDGNGNKLM